MSYHIKLKEYKCPKCEALYVPYEENLPCPSCKTVPMTNVSKEYFRFVDGLITSLRINKINGGSYLPGAWYIGSFVDSIQELVFKIFNYMEIKKPKNMESFTKECLDLMIVDDKSLYLKDYFYKIILKIYSRRKELKVSLWTKISSMFYSFYRETRPISPEMKKIFEEAEAEIKRINNQKNS
ncbi:MAG: hypothetical protein WC827_04210 [Candidatus Paceibacterota bacterium]|jgi:hypothetical protein